MTNYSTFRFFILTYTTIFIGSYYEGDKLATLTSLKEPNFHLIVRAKMKKYDHIFSLVVENPRKLSTKSVSHQLDIQDFFNSEGYIQDNELSKVVDQILSELKAL